MEAARESGGTEEVLGAFTAAAGGLLAAGEPDRALELLAEAAAWPHAAEASLYPACLPEMARTATDADDPTLAQRLVAPLEPTFAYHQYALCAAAAVLAEARGRFAEAAARHGEAADRWGSFGVVPERAHALLGRGRCLVALGHPGAGEPLRQARQVFAGLRAQPLAAEADALLGRAGTRA